MFFFTLNFIWCNTFWILININIWFLLWPHCSIFDCLQSRTTFSELLKSTECPTFWLRVFHLSCIWFAIHTCYPLLFLLALNFPSTQLDTETQWFLFQMLRSIEIQINKIIFGISHPKYGLECVQWFRKRVYNC